MLVKNYVKKAAIVGIAAVAGISLFACKKAEAPIPKADIRIDVDADISDGNKINEKTQLTREQILRGEYTEKDNVTMDDIKVVVLDKNTGEIDRHLGERPGHKLNSWQSGDETEIWGSYIATLEDVKSWPIGPHGWQEPPEDFKIRTRAYGKEGVELNDYTKNLFEKVRTAWVVNVEINGKLYALHGVDAAGDHRRSISTTDKNGNPDMELLVVDGKNKTDWLHLLALAIGNDKIVEGIAGGMPIKNNVN